MADEEVSRVGLPIPASEGFDAVYANHAYFETSLWDFKIIFGQLEQSSGKALIDWHTAVTMPWIQAKILSFYLQSNIAIFEDANGTISIPPGVLPPAPKPVPEQFADDPKAQELNAVIQRLYDFIILGKKPNLRS